MYFLGFNWNPNETIFKIGFVQIKYYNLLWILAFVLGLGHVFFYDWDYYKDHLVEILLPIRERADSSLFGFINGWEFTGFAGLASHGAAIAAIISLYLFSRKYKDMSFMWLLDRVTITCAIGAVFVRLGNFFNSEINGNIVEKSFVLATRFIRDSDDMPSYKAMGLTSKKTASAAYNAIENNPKYIDALEAIPYRHPAQLYEAILYLILFGIMYFVYWKTNKAQKPGFLFGLFMVGLWSSRFVVEFFKKSQGGFEDAWGTFSTGQWLSIPMILIGLYFMFRPTKEEVKG